MARATFGGTAADYVVTTGADGLLRLSSATLTMWTAATGGTQITDLLLGGSPVTSVPVGADGSVPTFQGPDGVTELWADAGHGRVRLTAPVTVVDSAVAALASNPASALGGALSASYAHPVIVAGTGIDPTGATDSTAAIQAKVNAAATGALLYLPAGTYRVDSPLTIPDYLTIQGEGRATLIDYRGSAAFVTLSSKTQVKFRNLRLRLTSAAAIGFDVSNSFRCSWTGCIIEGQHTSSTGTTYRTQYGFKFRDNAGDNRVIDCDINNLGRGVRTDAIMNYMVGCVIGTCWRSIEGGDPTGVAFNAGMSISACTFVSTAAATDRHLYIEGTASLWWLVNTWMEGAATTVEAGAGTFGPFGLTMQGVKLAGTTNVLKINAARQVGLMNVDIVADSGGATPTEVTINATNAPDGAAINVMSHSVFDYPAGTFPKGWQYVGRTGGQGVRLPTTTFGDNSVFTGITPDAQAVASGVFAGLMSSKPRVMLSDGTNSWAFDMVGGNQFRLFRPGAGANLQIDVNSVFQIGGAVVTNLTGSSKAIAIPNGAPPSGTPGGGGVLYVESGALKYKGSSGTVTVIAPA